jgi:ABC-2 type transport system permease protein
MSSRAPGLAGGRRPWSLRGPGGIFAKGLRDSRRAIALAGIGMGSMVLVTGWSVAAYYPTIAGREQQLAAAQESPAFNAMFGPPIDVLHLGGLLSWNDGWFMALMFGLWSIVALSGTLAGEARAGSLEMLAAAPVSRPRIAGQKLAVHLVGVGAAVIVIAAMAWLSGVFWAVLPGDEIAFSDALAEMAGLALLGLAGGAIAFALAPLLGRRTSAGIAAAMLFGAFFVTAYADLVPALGSIRRLSWFSWAAYQHPLAHSWDIAGLLGVAGLVAVLLVVGVLAFERRDLGSSMRLPGVGLPGRRFLLRGPARLAHLGSRGWALGWGLGVGLAMALFGLAGSSLAAVNSADPASESFLHAVFGDVDLSSGQVMLQLAFAGMGYLAICLVAATLVDAVAADERERRLELVLSTPLSRRRWLWATGAGLYGSLALLTLTAALLTALGAAGGGQDALQSFAGIWVGGLYAAALVGLGLAALGLGAGELAGAVPAALAIGFYAFDVLGSVLRIPPEIAGLSLSHHLGRPMIGVYDWPGMVLLAALAIGGPALGGWGLRRRDLSN